MAQVALEFSIQEVKYDMSIQATVENIREKFKVRLSFRVDEKGGKNALIYGLCEGVGIETEGMEPKEAWDAYTEKTGKTSDAVYAEKGQPKKEEKHAKPKGPTRIPKTDKPFSADAYSEERKKNALWSSNPKEVDAQVRGVASKVWLDSSTEEQRNAIRYTKFSAMYNDPQREAGAKGDYSAQGQGAEHLTNMINKSSYDFDMKLQRGTTYDGAAKFLGVDDKFLRTASDKELNDALVGREPIEFGFCSTGGAKGYGTTPEDYKSYKVQYQIYAPAGTKMLYAEPFSWYNKYNNDPIDWDMYDWWDGESPQKGGFSREFEMLVQRNTRFRVSRVRRDKKGILWVDLDIISQET